SLSSVRAWPVTTPRERPPEGTMLEVAAAPFAYAFDPATTALVGIDMQRDFIEPGGFGWALGNDVSRLAAIVPTVRELIAWCRSRGIRVLHTREGHRPDLTDCRRRSGDGARRRPESGTRARWAG